LERKFPKDASAQLSHLHRTLVKRRTSHSTRDQHKIAAH
jgi:hypothetical protein